MAAELISKKEDFPNLGIFLEVVNGSAVFRINFRNPEFDSGMYGCAVMLALPGWPIILGVGLYNLIPLAQQAGMHWSIPVAGILAPIAALVWYFLPPNWKVRNIVIDTGNDVIGVPGDFRKWSVKRQFSKLKNLTVEPHPQAELEARQKRGQLGPFQKQHCLFGWFGAGGAEKVCLMTRFEYPPQNSLFEVRQAIVWVIEKAGIGEVRGKEGERRTEDRGRMGIKPPLD